ncbi:hypothetical protein CF68_02690 [Cupriavidus sp. SK-4]|nr:hypothetical protein CF68_02690 [Cupriavidus sp. SK-4]
MAMAKSPGAPKRIAKEITLRQFRYFAAAGFGVLTDMVYRPWSLEGKQIEARTIAAAVPDMEVGMLWQAGLKLDKPADALREFLIHACGSRARCSRPAGARRAVAFTNTCLTQANSGMSAFAAGSCAADR